MRLLDTRTNLCGETEDRRDHPENQHDSIVNLAERYFHNTRGWQTKGRNCGLRQPRFNDLRYGLRHDLIMSTSKRNYAIEVLNNVAGTVGELEKQIDRAKTTGCDKLVLVINKTCSDTFLFWAERRGVYVYFTTKRGGRRTLEPVIGLGTKFPKDK